MGVIFCQNCFGVKNPGRVLSVYCGKNAADQQHHRKQKENQFFHYCLPKYFLTAQQLIFWTKYSFFIFLKRLT
jgi:hypothetical protein